MSRLSIPPEAKKSLNELLDLSPEKMAEVIVALSAVDPAIKPMLVRDRITAALSSINCPNPTQTANTLMGLYGTMQNSDMPAKEFAVEVVESLEQGQPIAREDEARQLSDLLGLLSVNNLSVAVKAASVVASQSKVFSKARIFSDLRPVFSTDSMAPFGFVVTHTLRIDSMESGESNSIYIGLDRSDLAELEKILIRAKSKDASLRTLMATAKIKDLETEGA